MKITDVKATVVSVPNIAPWRFSLGVFEGFTKTIIQVLTEEGTIGLGETLSDVSHLIEHEIKPKILGEDPFDIECLAARCLPYRSVTGLLGSQSATTAFGGVEVALWDIIGKLTGKPLCKLLGGMFRSEVSFVEYFAPRYASEDTVEESSPQQIAKYCAEALDRYGAKTLEGKVGVFPPKVDIEMIKEIRNAVGYGVELRIDANQVWSPGTAIRTIKAMERYELSNVEEPTRSLEAMAKVKKHVDVPISTHSVDIPRIVALDAADTVVSDIDYLGGILATKKLIATLEKFDLGFWLHSAHELGIATAANTHLIASTPHIVCPSQSLLHFQKDDIIKGGKPELKNGCIRVPTRPGLGIELDQEKVKKYSLLYQTKGSYPSNIDRKRPEWTPTIPMW